MAVRHTMRFAAGTSIHVDDDRPAGEDTLK